MAQSWTDPLTNTVILDGMDSSAFFRWHVVEQVFSNMQKARILTEFMHEYTHHWCFSTMASTAISLLELRLFLFKEHEPEGNMLWYRDYALARAAQLFFRPWFEGMSQFAEFDTWNSSRWHAFASPISAVELCFMKPGGDLSEALLTIMRNSSVMVGRKASLYLKPFEIEYGYLGGYVAVKRLHLFLCRKKPDLTQELFLAFLRQFLWNDPALVSIILDDDLYVPSAIGRLSDRFHARINALMMNDKVVELINQYEHESLSKRLLFDTAMDVQPEAMKEAIDRVNAYFAHTITMLEKEAPSIAARLGTAPADLLTLVQHLPAMHNHIIVARTRVNVVPQGSAVRLVVNGPDGFAFDVPSGNINMPAAGEQELVAVMSTFTSYLVFALLSDVGVFCPVFVHSTEGREIPFAQIEATVRHSDACNQTANSLRSRFAAVAEEECLHYRNMEELLQNVGRSSKSLLMQMLLSFRKTDEDPDAMAAMVTEKGFAPLFDDDTAALKLIACYSLLNNAYQEENELAAYTRIHYGEDDAEPLLSAPVEEHRRILDQVIGRQGSSALLFKIEGNYIVSV